MLLEMSVLWISTGCDHDALLKISERGNGIRKCVASVPRFFYGADDAPKLFSPLAPLYALIKMPELLFSESLLFLGHF